MSYRNRGDGSSVFFRYAFELIPELKDDPSARITVHICEYTESYKATLRWSGGEVWAEVSDMDAWMDDITPAKALADKLISRYKLAKQVVT